MGFFFYLYWLKFVHLLGEWSGIIGLGTPATLEGVFVPGYTPIEDPGSTSHAGRRKEGLDGVYQSMCCRD